MLICISYRIITFHHDIGLAGLLRFNKIPNHSLLVVLKGVGGLQNNGELWFYDMNESLFILRQCTYWVIGLILQFITPVKIVMHIE